MNKNIFGILIVSALFFASTSAQAAFDFGGDCSSGEGTFQQPVTHRQTVTVGSIPINKRNVSIELASEDDVDIQLIDEETGDEIIAWPYGLLNGATEACTMYKNARYCYSGYNGKNGMKGVEWIRVDGDTNRPLVMKAYGYQAGDATVSYSWSAVPTCYEKGNGEFLQSIARSAAVDVGVIPRGIVDVYIELDTANGKDVDVQIYDGTTAVVQWPNGLLSGSGFQTLSYKGVSVEYSGYNGTNGNYGRETIRITGRLQNAFTMKAFGYQAGTATVTYEWGQNAGKTCMGIATLQCADGYHCKAVQTGVSDPAGQCHVEEWCAPDSVAADCANLMHIAVPGYWACEEFRCVYKTGPQTTACSDNSDCSDGFCGWDANNARVCKSWGQEGDSCQGFVMPAYRNFCDPSLTCIQSEPTFDVPGVCTDLSCSMLNQACPTGYTCEWGCPTNQNCGINPPGQCVLSTP
jgi:hypothetical protein